MSLLGKKEAQASRQVAPGDEPSARVRSLKAQTRFFNVFTVIGSVALLLGFFYLLTLIPIPVGIILWSVIIIFCLRTPVNYFESIGINRVASTAISYVIMVIVLGIIGLLLFSPVFGFGEQFANLVKSIPDYINSITNMVNDFFAQYADILQNDTVMQALNSVMASLGDTASKIASQSAGGLVSVGTSVANSMLAIGFAFVVAFWILMDLPGIGREIYRIADVKYHEDLKMIHLSFTRVMGGYIKATLFQCAIIGLFCGILFAFIGIPNAVAFGVITGLLNIVPIVGPWFGGALAGIVGVIIDPLLGVVALVGTIVIQQFVYTFVSPKIMQDSVDIHPAVTLIIMMIGSALGGIMAGLVGSLVGMLFSIPLIAVAKSIFVYKFEKKTGRRIVSEDGVFFKATLPEDGSCDPMGDATSSYRAKTLESPKLAKALKERGGSRKAPDAEGPQDDLDGQPVAADAADSRQSGDQTGFECGIDPRGCSKPDDKAEMEAKGE